jgi:hypothetical protein
VIDEFKLRQDAEKAVRAKQLIDNDLLQSAFTGLEEAYTAAWRATTIDEIAAREKLFLAINIVGKVRQHLAVIVTNGKLAAKELQQLADTAERKKRYGTLE